MSYYFCIVGTQDQPLFELEFGTSKQGGDGIARFSQEARHMNPFIVHSSLDFVDELQWTNNQMCALSTRYVLITIRYWLINHQVSQTRGPIRLLPHLDLLNPHLHTIYAPPPPAPTKHPSPIHTLTQLLSAFYTLHLYACLHDYSQPLLLIFEYINTKQSHQSADGRSDQGVLWRGLRGVDEGDYEPVC